MNVCNTQKQPNINKLKQDFQNIVKHISFAIPIILAIIIFEYIFYLGLVSARTMNEQGLTISNVILFNDILGTPTTLFGYTIYQLNVAVLILTLTIVVFIISALYMLFKFSAINDIIAFFKLSFYVIFIVLTGSISFFYLISIFDNTTFHKLSDLFNLNYTMLSTIGGISFLGYTILSLIKVKNEVCKRYF